MEISGLARLGFGISVFRRDGLPGSASPTIGLEIRYVNTGQDVMVSGKHFLIDCTEPQAKLLSLVYAPVLGVPIASALMPACPPARAHTETFIHSPRTHARAELRLRKKKGPRRCGKASGPPCLMSSENLLSCR